MSCCIINKQVNKESVKVMEQGGKNAREQLVKRTRERIGVSTFRDMVTRQIDQLVYDFKRKHRAAV